LAPNAGDFRTPLIFLTAITDQQTMIDGLDLGRRFHTEADRPGDPARQAARLHPPGAKPAPIARTGAAHRAPQSKAMRRESEIGAHVLDRVLAHTELPDGRDLQYRVVPSAVFSGDMVLARRTPAGRLHLLLADAVGHGLPAAINILPLFFPFDGMSRKGCTLATVARELNRRVRDLLPSTASSPPRW
jgi:hypothetical protein